MISKLANGLSLKGTLRNLGVYFIASVINRAIPFFLLPLLTHYLTPAEYGLITLYQICITFLTPMMGMNMQANITRKFFRSTHEELAEIVTTLVIVLAINSLLVMGVMILFVQPASQWLEIDVFWLYTIPFTVIGSVIYMFNLTIIRNQRRPWSYSAWEIGRTIVNVGITLLLVVIWQWGWLGRATGIAISSILFGGFAIWHLWYMGYLVRIFSRERIREILLISVPLISHTLSTAIIDLSDRFFIDQMIGKEALGVYNVGYQFGLIVGIVANSVNLVWGPWMYEQLAQLTTALRQYIVKVTYAYMLGVLALALVVSFASYFLIPILTPFAYAGATNFVLWVALGYMFRAMYTMVFPYIVHEGKTSMLGIITLGTAVLNLAGNYILIQLNGTIGAAQSTLLSYLCQFLLVWWYAHKIHPMPWRLR